MKYKVILRDDTQGVQVSYREAEIETDESISELTRHAHIVEVLGVVEEKQVKPVEAKKDKKVSKK